jgi:K+-sensing histidine kinase KdpD
MWIVKGAVPVAVALAVVCVVTAVLWHVKLAGVGPYHPVFFYLLPIALIAMVFGSLPAILCTIMATLCAAFFLYDPIYSFTLANTLEWGDLVCFAVVALIGVKCTVELSRPVAKIPAAKSSYESPLVSAAIRAATPADPTP